MTGPNIASLVRPEAQTQTLSIHDAIAPAAAPAAPEAEVLSEAPPAAAPKPGAAGRIEALLNDVQTRLQELHGPGFATVVASSVVKILMEEGRLKALVEQVMAEMVHETARRSMPAEIPAGAEPSTEATPSDEVTPSAEVAPEANVVFQDVTDPRQYPFETLIVFSPTIGADLSPDSIDVGTWSVDDHGDTQPVTLKPSYHAAVLAHYRANQAKYGFGQHYVLQMGNKKA